MPKIERTIIDSAIVSVLAGSIILWVGITLLVNGYVLGFAGFGWGLGIIFSAILSIFYPQRHTVLGAVIVVFSLGSWYGTSGGLIIGSVIGVIGGFMTFIWKEKRLRDGNNSTKTANIDPAPK